MTMSAARSPGPGPGTLLMVSGASRGLGRAIAVAFAQSPLLPSDDSDQPLEAVLLARSAALLDETGKLMKAARLSAANSNSNSNSNLRVHNYSIDLGDLDTLEAQLEPIMERHSVISTNTSTSTSASTSATTRASKTSTSTGTIARNPTSTRIHPEPSWPPSRAILINCAGTTGYIGRNPTSLQQIKQAADLNLTSKTWLTSRFIHQYHQCSNTTVVNISSMCALKPTPTMALYCATSAGREMFHTVLAMSSSTTTRILNYAPGSCDTDMQAMLRDHDSLDPAVQAYCQSLVVAPEAEAEAEDGERAGGGGLVDCQDTAKELVRRVLEPGAFQNGDRVEYVNMSTYKY